MMQRRDFIALAPTAALASTASPFVKSICQGIFPRTMPLADQFNLARNAGFEGIEIRLGEQLNIDTPSDRIVEIADAARKASVAIVSLWAAPAFNQDWLNHHDPAARAKGVEALHKAIDLAKAVNCGALLIVPGRTGEGARFVYSYEDSWNRITTELKKAVAHAESAKVYLTLENVWNKFLLSPLEMRSFLDQFQSPYVQAHFDTGNVMQFGYPQDWIQTLGPRIKRVHIKDYKLSTRDEQGRFVDLLEGDVDWKEVMAAFKKAGYRGFMSPEMGYRPNDADYLMRVSRALDKILTMA
jgi:L-ribulose-5-phosphate 3-epimerase